MGKIFLGVRDVDGVAFRKLKALAVARRLNIGEALTKAINNFVEEKQIKEQKKQDPRNLLKIKPIKVGRKVRWSEEIDEILYGG